MTSEELDVLDARCAVVRGYTPVAVPPSATTTGPQPVIWLPPGTRYPPDPTRPNPEPLDAPPSVTRDPGAFVAAWKWCGVQGIAAEVGVYSEGASAWVSKAMYAPASEFKNPCPMVAFALALAAWGERKP